MKRRMFLPYAVACAFALISLLSCNEQSDDGVAPYWGARWMSFMKITRSITPDIQWLGGRVAAVGVNKGTRAALDSTLIWLRTAPDNSIGSFVTVGLHTDSVSILKSGGDPVAALVDSGVYTFWLAQQSAMASNLDTLQMTRYNFVDTTFMAILYLRGTPGGEKSGLVLRDSMKIRIDERFSGNTFVVEWNHPDHFFRRVAVRRASLGGFTDLDWHVMTPDTLADNIGSPVTLGVAPPNTEVIVPYPAGGLAHNQVYLVWMTDSRWTSNDFRPNARGYAWYRVSSF